MSFWSSFIYARPRDPPIISASDLGKFIKELDKINLVSKEEGCTCQLKYGLSIQADEKSTMIIDYDASGMIGTVKEYDWDFEESFSDLNQLAEALRSNRLTIYRAFLTLGLASESIVSTLTRDSCEDNDRDMCLCNVSLEIGPIQVASLGMDAMLNVGWIAINFSGNGYYFPWSFREVRDRVEQLDPIKRMMELCRQNWSVTPVKPSSDVIQARQEHRDMWLYDELDSPSDWRWFASETG